MNKEKNCKCQNGMICKPCLDKFTGEEAEHSPLPWEGNFGNGTVIAGADSIPIGELSSFDRADFNYCLEACSNYEKVKAQLSMVQKTFNLANKENEELQDLRKQLDVNAIKMQKQTIESLKAENEELKSNGKELGKRVIEYGNKLTAQDKELDSIEAENEELKEALKEEEEFSHQYKQEVERRKEENTNLAIAHNSRAEERNKAEQERNTALERVEELENTHQQIQRDVKFLRGCHKGLEIERCQLIRKVDRLQQEKATADKRVGELVKGLKDIVNSQLEGSTDYASNRAREILKAEGGE